MNIESCDGAVLRAAPAELQASRLLRHVAEGSGAAAPRRVQVHFTTRALQCWQKCVRLAAELAGVTPEEAVEAVVVRTTHDRLPQLQQAWNPHP